MALLLVVGALLAACGTSGRTLRDPAPGATAPPRKTTTTVAAVDTTPAVPFSLSSEAWAPGGEIPARFTCDGEDVSPPLTISGVPAGTAEVVLTVNDPSALGYELWAVAGIAPDTTEIPEGGVPAGATELTNDSGTRAWHGPCHSGGTRSYDVTAYALPAPSGLGPDSTPPAVAAAVAAATATAVLTGTYTR